MQIFFERILKMKKIGMIFSVILLVLAGGISCSAVSETDGGIFYSIEDGEATVEGFNAAGTVMDIPETIEGCPVKYIADAACRGNKAITEVRIPSSVTAVGEYAFAECPNLLKVSFADGAEKIGFSAFRDCSALMSVTLPGTLISIEDCGFYGCVMLGKLSVPESLIEIGVDVFMGCERLRLEVGNNAVAAEYAAKYDIPTSFTSSWSFTLLLLVVATILLAVLLYVLNRFVRKKRRQHKG